MGFRFRLGKHKNKLIALLLFLSIFVQQFVCPTLIRATELDNGFYATYWDLFNSIASEMGYSMSEIKEDHNVSRPDVMDRANVNFLKFMDWLGQTPSINHSGGGHDIEDDSSGDHSGGGTSIREDTEVYIEEAKNLMQNATTKGIKMSQGLWDAFRQYFSDVENDVTVGNEVIKDYTDLDSFRKYISDATGGVVPSNFSCYDSNLAQLARSTNIVCKYEYANGDAEYFVMAPNNLNATFFNTKWANGVDGYFGWKIQDSSGYWSGASFILTFCSSSNYLSPYFNSSSFKYVLKDANIRILAMNGCIIKGTFRNIYSPYINYTPIGTAPAQVPDIIPWSTFPDHEVIDDDTKIYIPVESPGEETPTETPEDPTETPEDPNDGDDIFDFDPIFPDIDIDPDIELPDDWINPPDIDIDLDPDVDVDTPSPGGKIPHLQKLKEKFPFCIPFDLVLLFKMLNKKPKAPKWEFKHDFQIGDSKPYTWEVVVDMADYDKYVQIFREGFFLLFLVGLFFVTKKLISWQTG